MDFSHSIMFGFKIVRFLEASLVRMCLKPPKKYCSLFRLFCVMSEIQTLLFGFQTHYYVSKNQMHKSLVYRHPDFRHLLYYINLSLGTPWSRGRTFARRPGGPGSNLAYSSKFFVEMNQSRSILSIAESGSVAKRKKSGKRSTRKSRR